MVMNPVTVEETRGEMCSDMVRSEMRDMALQTGALVLTLEWVSRSPGGLVKHR